MGAPPVQLPRGPGSEILTALCSAVTILKSFLIFEPRDLHFCFELGLTNSVAGADSTCSCVVKILGKAVF